VVAKSVDLRRRGFHGAALAAGDGDGLSAVSAAYEEMGDLLAAVDAAAQASVTFREANLRGSAQTATTARDVAGRCGDVHTPALSEAAAPVVFTGRMREVVMLAGGGLTNREIAERLQLSVRRGGTPLPCGRPGGCSRSQRIGAGDRPCVGDAGVTLLGAVRVKIE
jgi:hypothetical protein